MNPLSVSRRQRLRASGAACAAMACAVVLGAATPAHAFSGGNHEKITRAALGPGGWHQNSLTAMADGNSGAIVANDHGEYFGIGKLHCDNADYLDPRYDSRYPRTREQANAEIIDCVEGSIDHVRRAVAAADRLVDANGRVIATQTSISPACSWNDRPGRAKCEVLEDLGRGWHQIEDFYAHSNWVDQAGPGAIGVKNPPRPGAHRPACVLLHRSLQLHEQGGLGQGRHWPHPSRPGDGLLSGPRPQRDGFQLHGSRHS
ncbi:hypothetical protein AB0O82_24365 [Kitasatospora sp. NPDC088264]|uniref:hypothetical protein n=1 Tax=Kitasatospora sp. NPDC088264 TaxID=3155296 RepID=UPI003440B61E